MATSTNSHDKGGAESLAGQLGLNRLGKQLQGIVSAMADRVSAVTDRLDGLTNKMSGATGKDGQEHGLGRSPALVRDCVDDIREAARGGTL